MLAGRPPQLSAARCDPPDDFPPPIVLLLVLISSLKLAGTTWGSYSGYISPLRNSFSRTIFPSNTANERLNLIALVFHPRSTFHYIMID